MLAPPPPVGRRRAPPICHAIQRLLCHRNTAMMQASSSALATPATTQPPPAGLRKKRWLEIDKSKFDDNENNVHGVPETRFCLLMGDVQEERDALAKDWKRARGDANR